MPTIEEYAARRDATASLMTANPERFDMSHFISFCGTMHCIAGWAMVAAGWAPVGNSDWVRAGVVPAAPVWVIATEYLGLPKDDDSGDGSTLFYNMGLRAPEDAAAALKAAPYVIYSEEAS